MLSHALFKHNEAGKAGHYPTVEPAALQPARQLLLLPAGPSELAAWSHGLQD